MARSLTKRQTALAENLVDPAITTQKQAGLKAGYSDEGHISHTARNHKVQREVTRLRGMQRDKAQGWKWRLRKIDAQLDDLPDRLQSLQQGHPKTPSSGGPKPIIKTPHGG